MTPTPTATAVDTQLLVRPQSHNFHNLPFADSGKMSAPITIKIFGRGKTPVIFSQDSPTTLGANPEDFQIIPGSNTCAGSLLNCSVKVIFRPTALGLRTAALRFDNNASNSPQMVTLSGKGFAVKLIAPTAAAFGSVSVGSTVSKNITLRNTNDVAVTITGATTSDPEHFIVEQTQCATIPAHNSCQMSIGFHPTTTGPNPPAELMLSDDAAQSPQTVRLTGTGSP
jgi:hypothetical protein